MGDRLNLYVLSWMGVPLLHVCAWAGLADSIRKLLDMSWLAVFAIAEELLQRGIRFPLELMCHYFTPISIKKIEK